MFFVPVYTFVIFKIPSVTSGQHLFWNIYSITFDLLFAAYVHCALCSHAVALNPPKVMKITSFPLTVSFLLSFHLVSFFDLWPQQEKGTMDLK